MNSEGVTGNLVPARRPRVAKRAFDLLLSSLGLVIASPVMAAIWLRIRADRDGPVLFRGQRVGRRTGNDENPVR